MKKYLFIVLLVGFWGCVPPQTNKPQVIVSNPNLKPSNYKIAILPTTNNGNPKKLLNYEVSSKFQIALKEIGFKVVNYQIVEGIINEFGLGAQEKLTTTQLKTIQEKLKCDALCISSIEYKYVPPQGGANVNAYGGVARESGGFYSPVSESIAIINYNTFDTIIESTIQMNYNRSMSEDIINALKSKLIKPTPQ